MPPEGEEPRHIIKSLSTDKSSRTLGNLSLPLQNFKTRLKRKTQARQKRVISYEGIDKLDSHESTKHGCEL